MITPEKIYELLEQGEGLHVEMKACNDTLPRSIWESYSAFANTRGGVILLGITEDKSKPLTETRFSITGVSDVNKVITDFFNILNNKQKVSQSILVDSDVRIVSIDGKYVIHIAINEADYRQKPIYINNNIQSGTFKRVHEGDRHVTPTELTMLIRDSCDDTDQQIIEHYGMDDIDIDTLAKYRQAFKIANPENALNDVSDKEFLLKLGGYAVNRHKSLEGITMAGLLMFGKSLPIHENFQNFRVDYLDLINIELGDSKKWNDRLTDDGRWEDNLYNFLTLSMRKLLFTLPSEGKLNGIKRNDGGLLHEAVREAMVNSITYCDYKLGGVLRIDRKTDRIVMRNPGVLRISPERIYNGEYTQARNSTIQKMLRMVGFGDNIGSGFTKIMQAWKNLGFKSPDIREECEVNEVWLTLPLVSESTCYEPVYTENGVNDTLNDANDTLNSANDTLNGANDTLNDAN
ncbi:MAG: putative DNA binding domain-containing protein, partial [Muribaculaceae bacterium]|nr:putative DNA binding domain-containing protein [Muribaculaceae bacterium]